MSTMAPSVVCVAAIKGSRYCNKCIMSVKGVPEKVAFVIHPLLKVIASIQPFCRMAGRLRPPLHWQCISSGSSCTALHTTLTGPQTPPSTDDRLTLPLGGSFFGLHAFLTVLSNDMMVVCVFALGCLYWTFSSVLSRVYRLSSQILSSKVPGLGPLDQEVISSCI
jgi:hypothetical protein